MPDVHRDNHRKQYYSLENSAAIELKSNAISLQQEKQRLTQSPEGKTSTHEESPASVNVSAELARRVTAQILYSCHQLLHKQPRIIRLPGVSVTSVHSGCSCDPSQAMIVFTLRKTSA